MQAATDLVVQSCPQAQVQQQSAYRLSLSIPQQVSLLLWLLCSSLSVAAVQRSGNTERSAALLCWVQGLDLPALFEVVESARAELSIDEYSLSQTTLEQVFVALAGSSDTDPK